MSWTRPQLSALAALVFLVVVSEQGPASAAPARQLGAGSTRQGIHGLGKRTPQRITPPRIEFTSPSDHEQGVSLTRETIVYLDEALAASAPVAPAFLAISAGGPIGFDARLSSDGRHITLFYAEPLPSSQRVRVTVDGALLQTVLGTRVDAAGNGEEGSVLVFEFDTISIDPYPGCAVVGRVFASELAPGSGSVNVPLEGATISVDGAESTLFAVTDSTGSFRLDPAPAGRFFVQVDGTTATNPAPPGGYYPKVGKAWETKPGEEVNVGDAFLPLVPDETLTPVSTTQSTALAIDPDVLADHPELVGTQVTVRAGSLFFDDGTPGMLAGIAPVPPDRLPGPLPEGLEFPIVITVQTDGAQNFDAPAPARFPNLPMPSTGQPLPAGSDATLWSFNHDAGRWDAVAPARVTQDGMFVETTGGGIIAPGWHGVNRGMQGKGSGGPSCGVQCTIGGLTAAFDCATSFIPATGAVKCGISIVTGTTATARDCAIGPAVGGNGWDCARSAFTNAAGVGFDCAKRVIPVVSTWFSCAAAAEQAGESCFCVVSSSPSLGASPHLLYFDFMQAWAEVNLQMYGSPAWTTAVDLTSGDVLAELATYDAFQVQLGLATSQGSDGDELITASEHVALSALSRPAGISAADVDDLVDYVNLTATLWEQGIYTHAQAGQSGFMDRDQFTAALDALDAAAAGFTAAGISVIDIPHATQDLIQGEIDQMGSGADPVVQPDFVLYALVDETNSIVQRGNLGAGGLFGSLSLNATAFYRATLLDTRTLSVGSTAFVPRQIQPPPPNCLGDIPIPECTFPPVAVVPRVALLPLEDDADDDGLSERAEFVVGTNPAMFDTDGDGVGDGAEVRQGLNALDGVPAATGVIATAPGASVAYDVSAFGNLAAVARGADGVSVYNVFNGMPPVLVALVDTPGDARAVALGDRYLLVADGSAGLAVIDLADPPLASIVLQLSPTLLGGGVIAVATAGELGFAGTSGGGVVSLDLAAGAVLDIVALGESVHDLSIDGEWLFALTSSALSSLRLFDFPLTVQGQVSAPGPTPISTGRRRLFVGGGVAYATDRQGYDTYDVSSPTSLSPIGGGDTAQVGWTQIVVNGTGFGVAAVGPNPGVEATHDVALYDASDPAQTDEFLVSYGTPGSARALSIYGGLAQVADDASGLQVVNYMAYDAKQVPPMLAKSLSPLQSQYEEGDVVLVNANVMDDVQVRSVELLLDGTPVQTDGNFPFQFYFVMPDHVAMGSNSHALTLRASDTGGNTSISPPASFDIVLDTTEPTVVATQPAPMANVPPGYFDTFGIVLSASERLDPVTLSTSSVTLASSGPDLMFGGMDDVVVPCSVTTVANNRRVVVKPQSTVPVGILRATIDGALVADGAGNLLDGDLNGTGGDDFVLDLQVTQDVDRFWDGGGDGTSWTNAMNWSGNTLPGATDDVLIDSPGTNVTYSDGVTTIRSLISHQPITITNGAISISQSSSIDAAVTVANNNSSIFLNGGQHTIRTLVLNSGNTPLDGSGDLTVTHSMAWSGGQLTGTGDLTLLSGATLTTPSSFAGDQARAFTNHGRVVIGTPFTWNKLAPFVNELDGTIEPVGGGNLQGGGTLTNRGIVKVSAGTFLMAGTIVNQATIDVNGGTLRAGATFQNDGSIFVAAGAELDVNSGTFTSSGTVDADGTVTVSGGGTRSFNGPFSCSGLLRSNGNASTTFAAGQLTLTGAVQITSGAVTFNDTFAPSSWSGPGAGQLTLNAPMTLPTITLTDGNAKLQGSGNVTVTSSITWSAGEMLGSGRTILASGATMSVPGGAFVVLYRTLENHGVITHSGNFLRLTQSGGIENASDGTLILNGESDLDQTSPTATFVANAGVLRHAGAGTTVLAANSVTNTGTFDVQAGTLRLVQGWTNVGTIEIDAGAIVRTEGALTLSSSSLVRMQIVSPSSFGLMQTTQNAAYDGTLELDVDGGYAPMLNDTFDVATHGANTTPFATIQGTDLGGGLMLVPSYMASALRLTVQ